MDDTESAATPPPERAPACFGAVAAIGSAPAARHAGEADAAGAGETVRRVDLDAVRRAYELTGETVVSILSRFGLSESQFRIHRVRGGWTSRAPAATPGALAGYKPLPEDRLELRLNRLVAIGAAILDRRLDEEGMTEANARALSELCRAQEIRMRSIRNEKAAKAREKKNHDAGRDFRDDPEWLLAEINRRLDRLGGRSGEMRGAAQGDPREVGGKGT